MPTLITWNSLTRFVRGFEFIGDENENENTKKKRRNLRCTYYSVM